MNEYQKIRAAIEAPLLVAFNNQVPPVPVFFDNVTAVPPDAPNEYVRVNLTFGVTQQSAITQTLSHPRGALVIRCFAAKGGGPARCQALVSIAADVVSSLARTTRASSKVFVRTGVITGPSFYENMGNSIEPSMSNDYVHFMGKISTSWHAILPCT
jgi:hypothetical protein